MNRLPPRLPHVRIALHDQNDFITNQATVLLGDGRDDVTDPPVVPPSVPLSPSAGGREAVVTLDEIKMHCRIEPDQTVEDSYLLSLEMAAHIHIENDLRRPNQLDASAPENIKLAMLVLIAHWYRNREAVDIVTGSVDTVPLAYSALLSTEREYSADY